MTRKEKGSRERACRSSCLVPQGGGWEYRRKAKAREEKAVMWRRVPLRRCAAFSSPSHMRMALSLRFWLRLLLPPVMPAATRPARDGAHAAAELHAVLREIDPIDPRPAYADANSSTEAATTIASVRIVLDFGVHSNSPRAHRIMSHDWSNFQRFRSRKMPEDNIYRQFEEERRGGDEQSQQPVHVQAFTPTVNVIPVATIQPQYVQYGAVSCIPVQPSSPQNSHTPAREALSAGSEASCGR